uniref:DNA/RNA non-specific endonuclease domain-containing protein n=1 Tax=Oryzias melastigma TaxID=30732 RepID=A0A3B3BQU0_ORYME
MDCPGGTPPSANSYWDRLQQHRGPKKGLGRFGGWMDGFPTEHVTESEKMLLFLLLVFLPAVPIETEVVETLADCPGYFVEETPPEIPNILVGGNILNRTRYKVICQTFENKKRFLTLYDTDNKIPVFSAYRFTGAQPGRPTGNLWKTEPQLEDYNQALNSDYTNKLGYNRGHLYPNCHAPDWDSKLSTFTLTNVVPQSIPFNGGSWAKMENCTKCYMEKNCINANGEIEAFVVTGAEPGGKKLNDKINIPSRMWSAFCCYNSRDGVWLSKAYWGHNVPDKCTNLEERSCDDIKDTFGIQIFPKRLCSFKKLETKQRSKRSTFCRRSECECLLENSTTTAPPTTTDKTSEKTTFPPRTTATTTTTLMTTTKLTKYNTSTTTKKENKDGNTGNKGGEEGGGGGSVLSIDRIISTVVEGVAAGLGSVIGPVASGIGSGIATNLGGLFGGLIGGGGDGGRESPIINPKFTSTVSKMMKTVLTTPQTSITVPTTNEKTMYSTSVTQTTDDGRTGKEYGKGTGESSTSLLTPTIIRFTSPNKTPGTTTLGTTVLSRLQTSTTVPSTNEKSTSVTDTKEEDSTRNASSHSFLSPTTFILTSSQMLETFSPPTFAPETYTASQPLTTSHQVDSIHLIGLIPKDRPTEDDDYYYNHYYYYYNYYINALNNQAEHYLSCN